MEFTWNRAEAAARGQVVAPAAVAPAAVAPAAGPVTTADPVRVKAGALLGELYAYLRDNAVAHPSLAGAIPVLSSAVAEYRTGRAADPVAGVRKVYAAIEAARRGDPSIPEA
jgi:hypothetical protein